eukprot:Platyproteum_vivax@DN7426_c0_g1_i1.p1
MKVRNRHGDDVPVEFDKILLRITKLCAFDEEGTNMPPLNRIVDPALVTQKVVGSMHSGITTSQLDVLASEVCAYLAPVHPDYSKLAARIAVSNLHRQINKSFAETIEALHNFKDEQGRPASLISPQLLKVVRENKGQIEEAINMWKDYEYDFFGFKTLEKSYLLKLNNQTAECPQFMLMRVALGIHMPDVPMALDTYRLLSDKCFTHATPTLFNAGTHLPQMSSCFLLTMKDDSIAGIFETLHQCALISRTAGGAGLALHNVRSRGSYIRGSNGTSNGLVPMLNVFNNMARYVNGGGRRKAALAVYLEPWHSDIEDFLELRKNHGKEEARARDLFYALWVPDLFMQRVEEQKEWTLMDPNECPGLSDVWGEEFEKLYVQYETSGKGRSTIPAQQLWRSILASQMETGTPYMMYKDACNRKSNQKNLGTIKCSNLCTEVVQYSSAEEVAVCNLGSIALSRFIISDASTGAKKFDFERLHSVTKVLARNLNKIIDNNFYPIE